MYKSDIEIANSYEKEKIVDVVKKINLDSDDIELYGNYKAKINNFEKIINDNEKKISSTPLVLVTAINPTPYGEGKTTVTIGLSDALRKINKKSVVVMREPSLGPVFGLKGGACGGGMAQVVPMDEINLHFTGDFHAIGAANNLIAAMLDNSIYQGNKLNIDKNKIVWHRCVDMNDRALRNVKVGIDGKENKFVRDEHFDITVATELMAVFCLSNSYDDLRDRLSKMIVAYDKDDNPIYVRDLNAVGACMAILKDAFKPNVVQTLYGTPAIIHGGPFANIAHGCNSIVATKLGLALSDIAVTEAGFGADLGAEKFLDIKCRISGLRPSVVVLVATVRALKYNGANTDDEKKNLNEENIEALKRGIPNLIRHIENIKNVYNLSCIVAINKFIYDTENEVNIIIDECKKVNTKVVLVDVWKNGAIGGIDLANEVIGTIKNTNENMTFAYDDGDTIDEKISKVAKKIYRAKDVVYENKAKLELEKIKKQNFDVLPICIAKTQYSFSDNANLLGAPSDFTITIRDIKVCNGAGFIVVYAGNIMTMPGLPKVPAAEKIDIDCDRNIVGIF